MNKKYISVKRIFAAVVALAMTLAMMPAAFAADITLTVSDCTVVEDTVSAQVTLSGASSYPQHLLSIVTVKGKEANLANAVALAYSQAEGASAQVDVKMPDTLSSGNYTVTVGTTDAVKAVSKDFVYMGYQDRVNLMNSLNGENASAEGIVKALNSSSMALDISGSSNRFYSKLGNTDKLKFAQYIIDHRGDQEIDMAKFGELANEAFVVVYADSEELSKDALAISLSEVFTTYADLIDLDITDERFVKIGDASGFFSVLRAQDGYEPSLNGIKACLESTLMLQRINEVGYLEIASEVKKYNDFFGADEDEIKKINSKTSIKEYFGKAMKASDSTFKNVKDAEKLPVKNLDEFNAAWERSYKYAVDKYNDDQSGSGSSGSSSGSSGSSSSSSNKTTTISTSTVRSDPLQKKKLITDYYDDMAGYEWASSAVLALTEDGIVNGTGEKKFAPERYLTREEFMKLLVNTFNLADHRAECTFTDVTDKTAWYYIYVASAQAAGITTGRGDGTFGLGDYVTREEMATLVYRAAVKAGVKMSTSANTNLYSDMSTLSDYSIEAVTALTNIGVMSGNDGKFSPKDYASRAQAAVVINNIKSHQ